MTAEMLEALSTTLVAAREKLLRELDMEGGAAELATAAASLPRGVAGGKRKRPAWAAAPADAAMVERRRSSRVAAQYKVDYREDTLAATVAKRGRFGRRGFHDQGDGTDDDGESEGEGEGEGAASASSGSSSASAVPRYSAPSVAAPGSLRTLRLRAQHMRDTWLGLHVPVSLGGPGNQAKRAVMNEACADRRVQPTFSRMSGIQEWSDAVLLFVNLGPDSSNDLLDDGTTIVWYAQNRQTVASAQIQRLIHHATGCDYPPAASASSSAAAAVAASATKDDDDDGEEDAAATAGGEGGGSSAGPVHLAAAAVCLAVRLPDEPYIWCGELDYVAHDPRTTPIRFVWRLRDAAALKAREGSHYSRCLASNGKPGSASKYVPSAGGGK